MQRNEIYSYLVIKWERKKSERGRERGKSELDELDEELSQARNDFCGTANIADNTRKEQRILQGNYDKEEAEGV